MTTTVHLFAAARQLAGADAVPVELPARATVGMLRAALAEQYPRLRALVERSAFAIDHCYADDRSPVPDEGEVACIPPVSGG